MLRKLQQQVAHTKEVIIVILHPLQLPEIKKLHTASRILDLIHTQTIPLSCSSDALLTTVATEKRISLIKAWEENEKAKADNKSVILIVALLSLLAKAELFSSTLNRARFFSLARFLNY